VRSLTLANHRLRASRSLHEGLVSSVMAAPISYFDVTPSGRILNRFAADMDKIDLELTQSIAQGMGTVFNVLGAVVGICVATKGVLLIPLVPLGYVYYVIQKWFRKSSTEIQRVESITRSPIFSDFSQTLSGTSTIRAYGAAPRFVKSVKSHFDTNNTAYVRPPKRALRAACEGFYVRGGD
jgi:ATP-binding cassette subfamily C (CFTR/MRP) protein 1